MTRQQNRVAIVTGASGGIGSAVAERLGRDGLAVVAHYAGRAGPAEELVSRIEGGGGRALAAQADVAEILSWLGTAPVAPDVSALEAHLPLPTLPSGDPDPQASLAAGRLLQEFAAYWYFAATIVEFFSAGPTKDKLRTAEIARDARAFDQLAGARQAFAIEATLAWERVSAFRTAWRLAALDRPVCSRTVNGVLVPQAALPPAGKVAPVAASSVGVSS
jgi:NAD(P)-dependent dehydrogenase (short-subunit alcohol dehydrogenase family)